MGQDVRISKEDYRIAAMMTTAYSVLVAFTVLSMFYSAHVQLGRYYQGLVLILLFVIGGLISLYGIRRLSRSVIILSDHWVEHWVGRKKRQVLVLDTDLRIHVDLLVVSQRPTVRKLEGIKLYKQGLGSIVVRKMDGWAEEDLKTLWWGLYAKDKRYRFKYDTDVELIKKAAAMQSS